MNYLDKPAPPSVKGSAKDRERRAESARDAMMHGQPPQQIDGLPGINPGMKPTKGGIQGRSASPANYNTSGMESALGAMADKLHPPKRRR